MTYQLHRLRTQLDDGTTTASVDCAVMGIANAAETVSDGKVFPLADWPSSLVTHFIRGIAGNQHDGLLFHDDVYQVWRANGFLRLWDHAGLPRPFVDYFHRIGWASIIRRLWAGWTVLLPVDYGAVNDGAAPSGSTSFSGFHMTYLANPWRATKNGKPHGHLFVDVADSLMDGRTRIIFQHGEPVEHTYPNGWQRRVRMQDYREAAGEWGKDPQGAGHASALLIKPRRNP